MVRVGDQPISPGAGAPARFARAPPTSGSLAVARPSGRSCGSADLPAPFAGLAEHLAERLRRVEARLARQAEHPLADAVALHLVGAGGDGDLATVEVVERLAPGHVVARRERHG